MLSWIGNLLIITPQVVALLFLAAAVAAGSFLLMLRSKRRLLATVAGSFALLLVPAAGADAVNAHYQYLPRVADVVSLPTWPTAAVPAAPVSHTSKHPRGAVVHVQLPGLVSGFGSRTALVYLPPQYFEQSTRRFPVVYLLHGSPGAPVDWFRAARAAEAGYAASRKGFPLILVAPRASRYWSDDSECVDGASGRVETYLTRDVPHAVDTTFRTVRSRAARAVIGNSSGGFCALNLGLRHRDLFSGIGDLSGFDRPTYDGGLRRLFGRRRDLVSVMAAEDPSQYVRHLSPGPTMSVYLDVGRSDQEARRDIERMSVRLRRAGETTLLTERRGGHDYGVWRPGLTAAVNWLGSRLTGTPPA